MSKKSYNPRITAMYILNFAYKNDVVSVGNFPKYKLETYRKTGLLKYSPESKEKYWITKKGLKLYKKKRGEKL